MATANGQAACRCGVADCEACLSREAPAGAATPIDYFVRPAGYSDMASGDMRLRVFLFHLYSSSGVQLVYTQDEQPVPIVLQSCPIVLGRAIITAGPVARA